MEETELFKLFSKIKEISDGAYELVKALKNAKLAQSDLDAYRKEVEKYDNVPKSILDKQLLPFLTLCGNNSQKAAKHISNYYQIKHDTPEFFKNRDIDGNDVQTSLQNQEFVILPPTPKNLNLILFRLKSFEPRDYDFDTTAKTYVMSFETALFEHGPKDGIVFLIDMKGSRFGHLFRPSISSMRKGLRLLQDGCPVDIKAIHVLNTFPFVSAIMTMIRPFTSSGFLSKIHWHSPDADMEKFYSEHIPKSCLPSDYGGDLGSVGELHEKHKMHLAKMKEYFHLEEKQMNYEFDQFAGTKYERLVR